MYVDYVLMSDGGKSKDLGFGYSTMNAIFDSNFFEVCL
jgi:hypothetical protein